MQSKLAVLVGAAVIAAGALVAPGAARAGAEPEGTSRHLVRPQKAFREGEILVRFKAGVSGAQKEKVHAKLGGERTKEFRATGIQKVRIPKRLSVEQAVALYAAEPAVAYAEPDFLYSIQAVPNDPLFPELYGLHNAGLQGTADSDIDAPEAWNVTTGSAAVVVAVIDTGVDYLHEDLWANVWTNAAEIPGNGVDDDGNGWVDDVHGIDAYGDDGDPMDDNGHGTHVAGTIGAAGNNGLGVVGVAWNVRIMALKFLNANGSGYTSDAVTCLEYLKAMKDRGVPVVAANNSWGGGSYSHALQDAIGAVRDTLFFAAAGNDASDDDATPFYPASYPQPNVVAVAATDYSDALADFSNSGRRSVSVAAPGVTILSTYPSNGYTTLSGTSMATPHVTGLAALLKAADPSRDWRAIKNLILSGGDRVASVDGKTITGRRINAFGSLTCAGRPVFSALQPGPIAVGLPTTVSALSIDCAAPVGPVVATALGGGSVALRDDGVAPDVAAGDGVFAGTWTPVQPNDQLTFASAAGTDVLPIEVAPVSIVSYDLPTAQTKGFYSYALEASGGALPYTWSLVSGTLPAGLSLNPATGEISGTPLASGQMYLSVQVTDAMGGTATASVWGYVVDGYDWMRRYPLVNYFTDAGTGVAVDASGNVFVTGWIEVQRNPTLLVKMLTVKYDAAGNVLWAKTHDTGYYARAEAITVDRQGNAYVAGTTYAGTAGFDWLVVKYDPAGNVAGTFTYSGAKDDWAYGVAVDAAGNVYVTGSTMGRKTADALVVKFSAAGKQLWAKSSDGGFADAGRAVSVDAGGNVYVASSKANATDDDFLVTKYSSTGRALWAKTLAYARDVPSGIGTDSAGNVYMSGTSTWGDGTNDYSDTVLAKFTSAGQVVWWGPRDLGGLHDDATDLVVTPAGVLYLAVSGYKIDTKDTIAYKLDSSSNVLWSKGYSDGDDHVAGIAVDGAGHVYVGGDTVRYDSKVREYLVIKYRDEP